MSNHNFKQLKVWQKSRILVVDVYKITKLFPDDEKYALTSQIKRSVVSIPSNIAEGAGRGTDKDFSHFLDFAYGSSFELESQLINAVDLELVNKDEFTKVYNLLQEVQKMIYVLQNKLIN